MRNAFWCSTISPTVSQPASRTRSTTPRTSSTLKATCRSPGRFVAGAGSCAQVEGDWKRTTSKMSLPSGARAMTVSTVTFSRPMIRSIHSPLNTPGLPQSKPSSARNRTVSSRSSTTRPMWTKSVTPGRWLSIEVNDSLEVAGGRVREDIGRAWFRVRTGARAARMLRSTPRRGWARRRPRPVVRDRSGAGERAVGAVVERPDCCAPGAAALGADARDDDEQNADDRPEPRRLLQRDEPDDERDRRLEAHQRPERRGRQPPEGEHLERERDQGQQDGEPHSGEQHAGRERDGGVRARDENGDRPRDRHRDREALDPGDLVADRLREQDVCRPACRRGEREGDAPCVRRALPGLGQQEDAHGGGRGPDLHRTAAAGDG